MAAPLHISSLSILTFPLLLLFFAVSGEISPAPLSGGHHTEILAPILANLGYQELAMAVPSLYSPVLLSWSGPLTLFVPSDDSVRSCSGGGAACSPSRLLRDHLAPVLLPSAALARLPFGSKIQTAAPGRCLTLTSTAAGSVSNTPSATFFVDGVEITRPDLFNDGRIVVHGLQGYVASLPPQSCSPAAGFAAPAAVSAASAAVSFRHGIGRLRHGGYSILALAMQFRQAEFAALQNATVFAVDDATIFAGGHVYIAEVRYHVVPNRLLSGADLMRMPVGSVLPTLVHGQHLVVTNAGPAGLRINYVPIKAVDVLRGARIVIHGVALPFPHLFLTEVTAALEESRAIKPPAGVKSRCSAESGECSAPPAASPAASWTVDPFHDGF